MATLNLKGPDGSVLPVDLGNEAPDSPKVKELMAEFLQLGFTPVGESKEFTPIKEGAPVVEGSFEHMTGVGPRALRDAVTTGVGSVASNTVLAPWEGGQFAPGPIGQAVGEALVPQNEQQLMKESLLALTGLVGTPARVASKIGLGIARTLSPALIDVATGQPPNPIEMALVGMGELGVGAGKWATKYRWGKQNLVKYETKLGDGIAANVAELLPDVRINPKTADLYATFGSDTFGNSKAATQLGKQFDLLDKEIDTAFSGGTSGIPKTIDLSTNPNLSLAVDIYRKSLSSPRQHLANNMTTTVQEARKAAQYVGDVAFDSAKAPGTVEMTATGASMRTLATGAKAEYKQLVERQAGPEVLARLESLDKQYGDANLLHSLLSPEVNKGRYHITTTGPRIKLEGAQEIMARSAELEKRGMDRITQTLSHGQVPGTGAEIGGLNPRVSGTPLGQGVGFMGAQLQIHTLKTPVTKEPRAVAGPIEAGMLHLLDKAGWLGNSEGQ